MKYKLNELQGNTDTQINEIRKTVHQNIVEKFNKKIGSIKKKN